MLSSISRVDDEMITCCAEPKTVKLPAIVVEPLTYKFLPIPTPPVTTKAPSVWVVFWVELEIVVIPVTDTLGAVSNLIVSEPFVVSIVI